MEKRPIYYSQMIFRWFLHIFPARNFHFVRGFPQWNHPFWADFQVHGRHRRGGRSRGHWRMSRHCRPGETECKEGPRGSRAEAGRTWRKLEVWVCLWNMWMWDHIGSYFDHIGKKYICTYMIIYVHMHVICICISHICKCGKLNNQSLLQIPPRRNCKIGSMDTDLLLRSSPFCSYRTGSNDTTNFIFILNSMATSLIHDTVFLNVFELFIYPAFQNTHMQMRIHIHIHIHIHLSIRSYIHTHNIYVWRHWKGKFQGANQPRMKHRRGDLLWIFEVDGEWLCGTAQKGRPLACGEQRLVRNWGTGSGRSSGEDL